MLAQTHLGFAKGPVLVAHQTEHRQQLRLGKLAFAEATAVGRQNSAGHLQGHLSKGQESDFGHRPSCLSRKHPLPLLVDLAKFHPCRGCQQSHWKSPGITLLQGTLGEGTSDPSARLIPGGKFERLCSSRHSAVTSFHPYIVSLRSHDQ